MLYWLWTILRDSLDFLADATTVTIGIIAIAGLIYKRHELGLALQMLIDSYRVQRTSVVEQTLKQLDRVDYVRKEDRPELKALLAQLRGELKHLRPHMPSLNDPFQKLETYVDGSTRVSEAKKRELVAELRAILEEVKFSRTEELMRRDSK